jgi:metal-responsive CopG/Arc/MetJ family transcriptional regulator
MWSAGILACGYSQRNHKVLGQGYNLCYTPGMKTAISLPEDLFRLAEAAARKMKMSRSQLYATALAEYLERRKTSNITDRLNKIYSRESSELDQALQSAQVRSLEKEDW